MEQYLFVSGKILKDGNSEPTKKFLSLRFIKYFMGFNNYFVVQYVKGDILQELKKISKFQLRS